MSEPDPLGTAEFDPRRVVLTAGRRRWPRFEAVAVERWHRLADLAAGGLVAPRTPLLCFATEDEPHCLLTSQLSYHHVAQGEIGERPWMASFCAICNGGAAFTPVVAGRRLWFELAGIYEGASLLRDRDTGSLWHHFSGRCLSGELEGAVLAPQPLLHRTVSEVLASEAGGWLALSGMGRLRTWIYGALLRLSFHRRAWLLPPFGRTLGAEDNRLPRMAIGLGVVVEGRARFYTLAALEEAGGAVVGPLGDRRVAVFVPAPGGVPRAFFTRSTRIRRLAGEWLLDAGETIRGGALWGADDARRPAPFQVYGRWYGFSLAYPGCEVFS